MKIEALPFNGMTKIPMLFHLDGGLSFVSFVKNLLDHEDNYKIIFDQFEKSDGRTLSEETFPKFLDYLVENIWGEEGKENEK